VGFCYSPDKESIFYSKDIIAEDVRSFTTDFKAYFIIKNDNSLWAWGSNDEGQLGDNTGVDKDSQSAVKILDDVANVYLMNFAYFAIKNDKTLWGWGGYSDNTFGPKPNESLLYIASTDSIIYAPLKIADDVVSVIDSSHLLRSDGTVWTYDYTFDDNEVFYSIDVLSYVTDYNITNVGSLFKDGSNIINYRQTRGDKYNFYILRGDNSLWGHYYSNSKSSPPGVMLAEDVSKMFYFDDSFSDCVRIIKNDGTLWVIGNNENGDLGDGSKIARTEFVKIADNVKQAGEYCYITTDGRLFQWDSANPTPTENTNYKVTYIYPLSAYDNSKEFVYLAENGDVIYQDYDDYSVIAQNVKLPD
jgi:hypothetical protein